MRLTNFKRAFNYQYPASNDLDYKNEVIGVIFHDNCGYFNGLMSNGKSGGLEYEKKTEIKM